MAYLRRRVVDDTTPDEDEVEEFFNNRVVPGSLERTAPGRAVFRRAQKSEDEIQTPSAMVKRKPTPDQKRIGPSPPSSVTPTVSPIIFA